MTSWKTCTVVLILASVVGGCSASPSAQEPGTAPTPGPPVWVEPTCPLRMARFDGAPVARGAVPEDFVPARVIRCRIENRRIQDRATWIVIVAEQADTAAIDLVAELRQPSDSPGGLPPGVGCAAGFSLPHFLLVDAAGRAIMPAIPFDACRLPRQEALRALEALPFHIVSETPVRPNASDIQTGCASSWEDVLAIDPNLAQPQPAPARHLWSRHDAVNVCSYHRISGDNSSTGWFSTGRTITGDEAKVLLDALDNAGPAVACTSSHTRFAILSTGDATGDTAMIELDGCLRLLRQDYTLGQLDRSTVATLAR